MHGVHFADFSPNDQSICLASEHWLRIPCISVMLIVIIMTLIYSISLIDGINDVNIHTCFKSMLMMFRNYSRRLLLINLNF